MLWEEVETMAIFVLVFDISDLLLQRARIAVAYHDKKLDELKLDTSDELDPTFFTPGLYTAEQFCASISVDHFSNLQVNDTAGRGCFW